MKKIKYLLVLCMSIFCIGALSAHAAVSTTMTNEITLFENMGLTLPEKTNETDLITRGEFIGTITQLLNREFAPGGEYSFTDVPKAGDLSGKLSYAVAMGIVSDDTLFNPDANVTYPQAMKMAVAFLGRGAEAEHLGGYDGGGYNAVASTLKLYAGLQDMAGENVTLRDFYKILYNVGQADMLVRDTNNNLVTGNSPFEEYFNMYQIRGIVTYNEDTSLEDDQDKVGENVVAINKDMYRYDGDAPLGYRVDGWARYYAADMPEIVLIKPYKNTTTEISLVGIDGRVENNIFYYTDGGSEKKIKIDSPAILYNDIAAPTMKIEDIFNCKLGTAVFIDNDEDGYVDVIDIHEYRPVIVSVTSLMNMRIVDKNGAPSVELDNNSKVKKYSITKDGVEIELSQLAKDDFLAVYESKKGTHIKIEVISNTISGTVSSYNSVAREIKLDSTVYNFSDYFNTNYLSKIAYNSEINVYLTPDNVIHALAEETTSVNKYGLIIKWWDDTDTGKLMIKMADEKGEVKTVKLAKSIKLDGKANAKESDVKTRLETLKGRGRANLFIKYKLSDDGAELKVIDTYNQLTANTDPQNILTGNEDSDNNLTEYNFPQATTTNPAAGNQYYNKDGEGWAPYVSKISKIFVISTSDDVEEEEIFQIATEEDLADIANNSANRRNQNGFANRSYRIFNVDRFGTSEAVVITIDRVNPTITEDDPKGIVYRISKASNLDGEITYEMVVFSSGEYKTHFISEDYYEELTTGGMNFAIGDYIAYKVDVTGEIVKCEVIYDKSEGTVTASYLTTPNYLGINEAAFITGWIYDMDGSSISIIPAGYFNERLNADNIHTFQLGVDGLLGFPVASATINMISPDGKAIMEGTMGDITTFIQSPAGAEFVIIGFDEGALQEIILYK